MGVVADKIKAKRRRIVAESRVRGNEESERWRLAVNHEKEMLGQWSLSRMMREDTVVQDVPYFSPSTSIRLAGPQLPNRSQLGTASQQVYVER